MAEYIERAMALAAIEEEEKDYDFDTRDVLSGLYIAEDCISKIPSADVAPVRHGVPMLGVRMERFEVYNPAGMLDGIEVFKRRIITVEKGTYMRCPFCGKRLCSRFFNYCPNCGAKMDDDPQPVSNPDTGEADHG